MANEIKNLGIVLDDGRRRVPITNTYGDEVGVFYFNPTDMNIIERYNKMVKTFDEIVEPLTSIEDENPKDEVVVEALEAAKGRLYIALNEMFGGDMAGAFFGQVHPFSPVGGKFYCEVALAAVGEYISEQFKQETQKIKTRVSKYTKKYTKER